MMNVTLTVDCSNLVSVRPAMLTNKDKRAISDLGLEMVNTTSETEMIWLARKIINNSKRNDRIEQNELNIKKITDYIKENTVQGDIISKDKMQEVIYYQWDSLGLNPHAARFRAVNEAFNRLVENGTLFPVRMRSKDKVGRNWCRRYIYSTVYVVA